MRITALLLLALLTACMGTTASDDLAAPLPGAPSGSVPPATPPALVAPLPTAPPSPSPSPLPTEGTPTAPPLGDANATAAMLAYRAAIAAYDAHDAGAYFGAFLDPLECFHGTPSYSGRRLRDARGAAFAPDARGAGLYVAELTVLRQDPDEVVLLDRGAYWIMGPERAPSGRPYMLTSSDPIEQGVHERAIVMRLVAGVWRVAAETDRAHLDCLEPAVELDEMSATLTSCRAASTTCLRGCDSVCGECDGCNSCNLCPGECLVALTACVGAPASFSPYGA